LAGGKTIVTRGPGSFKMKPEEKEKISNIA
jgi:hypothetical protein